MTRLIRDRVWTPLALSAVLAVVAACDDNPGPPSGPGNTLINDTNQDALAHPMQYYDSAVGDVYLPQGAIDGAFYGQDSGADVSYASSGYEDASSPMTACSTCTCAENHGFCLENGTSVTVTAAPPPDSGNSCAMAKGGTLSVGCNPLPEKCATDLTCECLLSVVQPPLSCYPQCSSSSGYFDIYCMNP
jgi:hypothetical protein